LTACPTIFDFHPLPATGRWSKNILRPVASLKVHIIVYYNRGDKSKKKICTKKIENLVFFNPQKIT